MAKRWYSVSVLSNYEKKIAETIRQSVIDSNMEDQIEEVLVPTEEVIEVRRGKKVTTERRLCRVMYLSGWSFQMKAIT